jgi:hypothetical protein
VVLEAVEGAGELGEVSKSFGSRTFRWMIEK